MDPITPLRNALASSRFGAELARARGLHLALARYTTAQHVLDALSQDSELTNAERDGIVLALVTEHLRTRHPLWQTLLLVAYEPMLRSIARRTLGARRDDALQGALCAFLEAVGKVKLDHPPALLSLHLRHATERDAFGQNKPLLDHTKEAKRAARAGRLTLVTEKDAPSSLPARPQMISLQDARRERAPDDLHEIIEREDQMRRIVEALLDLFGNEADAREVLEVLLVARSGRPALVEYVDTTYPELGPAKRNAVYARLQRMRARALAHLTDAFGCDLAEELQVSVA
jgi:hypothetical protein